MPYTTIKKPSSYFNTVTYTGDGTSQNEITGVGFQPDFTWVKNRDQGATPNLVVDIIRGYGTSGKTLTTNETSAEASNSATSRFVDNGAIADGFTVGNSSYTNGNGTNYVSWNWLASNTTASNTNGSVTSTVSVNTTSGFSIVSYTGTGSVESVGHGLGVAPKMMIVKNRSITETWRVYHTALGGGQAMALNGTNATDTDASYWNNANPGANVFTVGTNTGTNGSGNNMIAYCFADVKGFSKFGSYVGNGSTDGPFIYTGFKPAFVIIKASGFAGTSWPIYDSVRYPENKSSIPASWTDLTDAEGSYSTVDFLSNGFKIRDTSGTINNNTYENIYMAFAEEPLVGDNPATAR